MKRRAMIYDVPTQFLTDILRTGTVILMPGQDGEISKATIFAGIPSDAKSLGINAEWLRRCVSIAIEHDSLPETEDGAEMKREVLNVVFETLHTEPNEINEDQ